MKIAYIALRGVPLSDGIVSYNDTLAKKMVEKGHEVTVYTSRRYGNVNGKYPNGYSILTVPSFGGKSLEKISIMFFASLKQLFRKYDIVHFHGFGNFCWMAKITGKKTIVQSHGIEYERAKWGKFAKWCLKQIEKKIFKGNALTVVSKALHNHFLEKYGKESIYIPTAVELPVIEHISIEPLHDIGLSDHSYYLFMARIVKEKGAHYLIEAFKNLDTKKQLVIAGGISDNDPYHKELLKMAETDSRIVFLGNVTGDKKAALLKGAYAFCQPSEIEGLSVGLLEAMSFSKCCIVSDIPMNTEAVDDCGVIFANKSSISLLESLIYCENNQDTVLSQGLKARKRVEQYYSWEIVSNQIEQLYLRVLKNEKNK